MNIDEVKRTAERHHRRGRQAYFKTDGAADAYALADFAVTILSDPSEMLPEMVWVESKNPFGHFQWTATTAIGRYQCGRQLTDGRWWAQGDGYLEFVASLEAGKAACREHLRGKVRELFGVKV